MLSMANIQELLAGEQKSWSVDAGYIAPHADGTIPKNLEDVPIRGLEMLLAPKNERTLAQCMEARSNNSHTPVNKCPYEVLGHIFTLCLPQWGWNVNGAESTTNQQPKDNWWSRHAPFLLSSVCTHWRDVALDIRTLWASPSLFITRREKRWGKFKLLALWLSRSNPTAKLSLTIHTLVVGRSRCRHTQDSYSGMTDLFRRHLGAVLCRVNRLDMTTNARDLKDFLFLGNRLLNLQELILADLEAKEKGYLLNLPALKSLTVRSRLMGKTHPFICPQGPPWCNLKELHLTLRDRRTWHLLLQKCPNLQQTSVTLQYLRSEDKATCSYPPPENGRRHELRHLHSLEIRSTGGGYYFSNIFENFYFPSLSHLNILNAIAEPPALQWTYSGHFFEQIKSLRGLIYVGPSSPVIKMLKYTPLLTYLDLTVPEELDVQPVLEFLGETQGEVVALPHLTELKFKVDGSDGDLDESANPALALVREMTKFRPSAGAPLKDWVWKGRPA